MQKTLTRPQSSPIKPATHLSHVLAWRGTPDRTNFAYAQEATITWDARPPGCWFFNSYLNGEKARFSPIAKGDFIWKAACTANYFLAVNASNTREHMRRHSEDGEFSRWDGEKLVPSSLKEFLKGSPE